MPQRIPNLGDARVGGQPLIESFDTNQISVGSKARTACWRFASSKP